MERKNGSNRVHEKTKLLNWNEQCDVCRAKKAKQLSLLFQSVFVSAAHLESTKSEYPSLAASDNSMISFCLDVRYIPQV